MGEIVEFPSNGTSGQGYLAMPSSGEGPGVLVLHEAWGLVPHIKDVCDRYAAEGFVALAPDLYRGETTTEPDQAEKLMETLDLPRAARDMSGALEVLVQRTGSSSVGVTGFGMGGGLALLVGTQRPDRVKAVVPYYGLIPWPAVQPDWTVLVAPVQGHYAELDTAVRASYVTGLAEEIRATGAVVEVFVYEGAEHAFCNDTRPEVYRAADARVAWDRTINFFREHLG